MRAIIQSKCLRPTILVHWIGSSPEVTEVWNRRGEELERRTGTCDPALQEVRQGEVLRVAVDLLDEGKLEQAKAGVRGFCYAAIRTDARSATSLVMRAGEGPDVRLGILFSPRQQQAIGAFAALCRQSAKPSDRKTVQPTDRRRRSRQPQAGEGRLYPGVSPPILSVPGRALYAPTASCARFTVSPLASVLDRSRWVCFRSCGMYPAALLPSCFCAGCCPIQR